MSAEEYISAHGKDGLEKIPKILIWLVFLLTPLEKALDLHKLALDHEQRGIVRNLSTRKLELLYSKDPLS